MITKLLKRRPISKNEAVEGLENDLVTLFTAYHKAVAKYNDEIKRTNPVNQAMLRAPLLHAKMRDALVEAFPDNFKIGKYNRFILHLKGFLFIIKKLNTKDKPSYVCTMMSNALLEQQQVSLFEDDEDARPSPLLIFGYTINSKKEIVNPRVVYYDIIARWAIREQEVAGIKQPIISNVSEIKTDILVQVSTTKIKEAE